LHYGFVVALLNDLFGIQARGGCSCAGPYGHALLGLGEGRSTALENRVAEGFGALRPGWVRLNVNYFIDEAELDYLLTALRLVARHGWRLLPSYRLDARAGLWRHRDSAPALPATLSGLDFLNPPVSAAGAGEAGTQADYAALVAEAERILAAGASEAHCRAVFEETSLPAAAASDCWFTEASEVVPTLREEKNRGAA
jgi:hypothetical protein